MKTRNESERKIDRVEHRSVPLQVSLCSEVCHIGVRKVKGNYRNNTHVQSPSPMETILPKFMSSAIICSFEQRKCQVIKVFKIHLNNG